MNAPEFSFQLCPQSAVELRGLHAKTAGLINLCIIYSCLEWPGTWKGFWQGFDHKTVSTLRDIYWGSAFRKVTLRYFIGAY